MLENAAIFNAMHINLQKIVKHARANGANFRITCSIRNKESQDRAFNTGVSKARYGQSPHNYAPSLAFDFIPLDKNGNFSNSYWNNIQMFKDVASQLLTSAAILGISADWGGSWKKFKDYPHFQLSAWKDLKNNCKPA